MKNSFPKIIVASLLALLLLGGSSLKEAVHACASHTDTVHQHRNDGQLQFDAEHHHCDFLSYCFPPFKLAGAVAPVFHFRAAGIFVSYKALAAESPSLFYAAAYTGRGPPARG